MLLVFQLEISWSKARALKNISPIFVTFDVSHEPIFLLKLFVWPNMRNIVVTLEVSHELMGRLNGLLTNISSMLVIKVVTMLFNGTGSTGDVCPGGINLAECDIKSMSTPFA